MGSKSSFKEGCAVVVDEKSGFTVQKLMNLSAKVEDASGKTKIVPYALMELPGGKGNDVHEKTNTAKKAKKEIKFDDPENNEDDIPVKEKPKSKKKHNPYVAEVDPEDDTTDSNDDNVEAATKKKYARSVGDDISDMLKECPTIDKMLAAARKHSAFKFVNQDSFKNLVGLKGSLQTGLFKMRLSNLLRGAVRKSEKE